MRMLPCGHGACGITFPGYRCKPFVLPMLFGECIRLLPLLVLKATKKRSHTPPILSWAMADCAFSGQRHIVYQYQRPSIVNSLLCAESDITARSLAYSLSADIVNIFLCFLLQLLSG